MTQSKTLLGEWMPLRPDRPGRHHEVIAHIVDKKDFFLELQAGFAQNAVVGRGANGWAERGHHRVGTFGDGRGGRIDATHKICRFVVFL